MTASWMQVLQQLASEVAGPVVLRTLPFVIWALLARRVPLPDKGFALLLYGALTLLANSIGGSFVGVLITALAGALYLTLAALALIWLVRRGCLRMQRGLLFVFCCVAFLVVPTVLFQVPGGVVVMLAGWELTFSGYSYAVESRAPARSGTLGEGLFFLLVNPVLCFPERGRWTEANELPPVAGVRRCATGVLLLALGTVLLKLTWQPPASALPLVGYGGFVGKQTSGILRVYFTHAGVAHLQLGLLSLMGYRAPERYVKPLLASSPAEFWRRWNVYVGSWFRRYVFSPLSYALARRGLSPVTRTIMAVLLTFLAAGAAHDVFSLLRTGRLGPSTSAFMLQALLLLGFEAVSRRFPAQTRVSTWLHRLCFWHSLMLVAWILTPAGS